MQRIISAVAGALLAFVASADEGLWTFDHPPRAAIAARYGVTLDSAWLDHARLATVRLEGGCTGSFISADGLVLTNHHCAESCIADNSTAERDLMAGGFLAGTRDQELRCQEEALSVLVGMQEVTAQVQAATANVPAAEFIEARRRELTRLEQACEAAAAGAGEPLKCEQVTLYQGGQYWLYQYRRYDDVRLVFAPERDMASFGGDPDNFQFPRWGLDASILRAYAADGQPARTPDHLRVDWNGVEPGDPVFVIGHPGRTDRLLTVAQLETQRSHFLPFWLLRITELRGRLIQYSKTGPEAKRTAEPVLNIVENSIKVRRKQFDALLDPALLASAGQREAGLRARVAADPALAGATGAWDQIEAAERVWRTILVPYTFIEERAGFNNALFLHARRLVRAAAERGLPNEARLAEYTEARLPALVQDLRAATPVYPELEILRLSFALERMREWLGPDHEIVRLVFGSDSPDTLAERLVRGSRLADPTVRMMLYAGGQAAIAASDDPMIRLAVAVDPAARALRRRYEQEVEGPVRRGQEAIARARFAALGTSVYPDATFTLRLSYGAMRGWNEPGEDVRPWTELSRAFERATGQEPFRIPERWLAARGRLAPATRVNFVTDNDVVGGNSGSPMLNARGDLVGLVFDGNIHSIAGSYWFDERMNRTIAVHPQFLRAALAQVYGAQALLAEIDAGR